MFALATDMVFPSHGVVKAFVSYPAVDHAPTPVVTLETFHYPIRANNQKKTVQKSAKDVAADHELKGAPVRLETTSMARNVYQFQHPVVYHALQLQVQQ